jgi:hypothetical protein
MALKKSWYSSLLLASIVLPLAGCTPYGNPYYHGQRYDYGSYYYGSPYYTYGYANPYYPYHNYEEWQRHQEWLRRRPREEREEHEKRGRREEWRDSAGERHDEGDQAKIEPRREPRPALRENAQPQRRDRDPRDGRNQQERARDEG